MRTKSDLSELFEQVRKAAPEAPASKILSLVEQGKTSPLAAKRSLRPRRIKQFFNPLKILIMITPIVIITTVLLLWNPGQKPYKEDSLNIGNEIVIGKKVINPKIPAEQSSINHLEVPAQNVQRAVDLVIKDTVFQGSILDLSKDELTRLGFMFDNEGFYYLNRLPDGNLISLWSWKSGKHSSSGFEESKSVHRFNKQKTSDFDFYPLISTSLSGQDLHIIYPQKSFTLESFNIMNDTLVPVLFKTSVFSENFTTDLLLWFKPSEKFFELIGNEKATKTKVRIQMVKELTLSSSSHKDRVTYDFIPDSISRPGGSIDSLKTIKLSAEIFACMGMTVSTESVDVKFIDKGIQYRWSVNKYGVGVSRLNPKLKSQNNQTLSNTQQAETPAIYAIGTDINKRVTSFPVGFKIESADLLIPVQIADSYLAPYIRKLVFWIYPNERFFNCLPPEVAKPMRIEFNYQKKQINQNFVPKTGESIDSWGETRSKDTTRKGYSSGNPLDMKADQNSEKDESVPCIYFTNLCESMPGLDYVNLYPNPASNKLNVDLVLLKAKKIRFRVFDLSGKVIADDGAPENYSDGGQYKHELDISRLQSGFYLLVMTDEIGAKVTRRFVKD